MKPESNGLASGGAETSLGSCATAGLVVTECNEAALLIHSTVSPFWIVTVSGTNLGGVSVILISTVFAAAIDGTAPATKISAARAAPARRKAVRTVSSRMFCGSSYSKAAFRPLPFLTPDQPGSAGLRANIA